MDIFGNSSSRGLRCSVRKGVLRNFPKFTGKHLRQSFFFKKLQAEACNFIEKETLAQVFFCEFCEISKNTFFTEHLWLTASGIGRKTYLPGSVPSVFEFKPEEKKK